MTTFFHVNIKLSSADECRLPNKGHSLFSSSVCFIMLQIHLVDRNVLFPQRLCLIQRWCAWPNAWVLELQGYLMRLLAPAVCAVLSTDGEYRTVQILKMQYSRQICILFQFVMKPPHLKAQSSNTTISLFSFPPSFLYSCTVQQLSSNKIAVVFWNAAGTNCALLDLFPISLFIFDLT